MRRSKLIYNIIFGKLYTICDTCYKVLLYNQYNITSLTRHTKHGQNKFENND